MGGQPAVTILIRLATERLIAGPVDRVWNPVFSQNGRAERGMAVSKAPPGGPVRRGNSALVPRLASLILQCGGT
jgi:hypothetical protein